MDVNVKFNYLYRDGANFKNYGYVIFSNPNELPKDNIESFIKVKLIDGEFFESKKVVLPELHFINFDPDIDHGWHEFESIELTDESPTDIRNIDQFLEIFSKC